MKMTQEQVEIESLRAKVVGLEASLLVDHDMEK